MKRGKSGFIPIWWAKIKLPDRAHRVGIVLWAHADNFGHCWPGIKTICKNAELDRRNVFRALDDLIARNLLSIHSGDAKTPNHYWLSLLPDEVAFTKKREKRSRTVVVQEPPQVVAIDEAECGGAGTTLTPIELPSITTREEKKRRNDGLTNEERVEAYLDVHVIRDLKTLTGDDFVAVARKRWPERFQGLKDSSDDRYRNAVQLAGRE